MSNSCPKQRTLGRELRNRVTFTSKSVFLNSARAGSKGGFRTTQSDHIINGSPNNWEPWREGIDPRIGEQEVSPHHSLVLLPGTGL